jgi:Zn-dependent M28 family amino/carboxypeptidase
MRALGLDAREVRGEKDGVKVVNLYGEVRGAENTSTNPPLLLVAHYDSTPQGPGAADDATGVGTALETVRALKARGAIRNTVGILLTDGEESEGGLPGSESFVRDHPDLIRELRLVINLEARGSRGPVVMFQTGPE